MSINKTAEFKNQDIKRVRLILRVSNKSSVIWIGQSWKCHSLRLKIIVEKDLGEQKKVGLPLF